MLTNKAQQTTPENLASNQVPNDIKKRKWTYSKSHTTIKNKKIANSKAVCNKHTKQQCPSQASVPATTNIIFQAQS